MLIAAIEKLKPQGEVASAGPQSALQYSILHEAGIQGRPVAYILTHLSISDSTYFRNRKAAVLALAKHLQTQEDLFRGGGANKEQTC